MVQTNQLGKWREWKGKERERRIACGGWKGKMPKWEHMNDDDVTAQELFCNMAVTRPTPTAEWAKRDFIYGGLGLSEMEYGTQVRMIM